VKIFQIALGILAAIGGFVDIGDLVFNVAAGATFGYQLLWVVVVGVVGITVYSEMCGRVAAVSEKAVFDAVRERVGFGAGLTTLVAAQIVNLMTLAAEIGGMAICLRLLSGLPYRWLILLAIVAITLVVWVVSFDWIERIFGYGGLCLLVFAVAAVKLHPDWGDVARGFVPHVDTSDTLLYAYFAVGLLGAAMTPYEVYFYSSGAIEEKWDESYIMTNRAIAATGMGLGGFLSLSVLVLAAIVFHPRGVSVDHYQQLPELLTTVFGRPGFWLVIASLGIACMGATLEIALSLAYMVAQGFGWNWGENLPPREDARFALTYTVLIIAASVFVVVGVDPLKLTEISMSLTAAALPIGTFPFLILMNDRAYLGSHTNGHFSNAVVLFISALAAVLAVVAIPLELIGG